MSHIKYDEGLTLEEIKTFLKENTEGISRKKIQYGTKSELKLWGRHGENLKETLDRKYDENTFIYVERGEYGVYDYRVWDEKALRRKYNNIYPSIQRRKQLENK